MDKLQEALEKHREVKKMMLTLLGKADSPTMTKQRMKDELFKIYMELK